MLPLTVYLAGEIHTSWREDLMKICEEKHLPITFTQPVVTHQASDNAGKESYPPDKSSFWLDHSSAKVNQVRIRAAMKLADLVVIRFGEKYRQWNAAFDAGYCAASGKPYLVIHPEEFVHALKEVDAAAFAVVNTDLQAAELLGYISTQK